MLSILIVNWNTREPLRKCLSSISSHPPKEPHEVIVVDNASADQSAEMVRAEFAWARLVEPGSNTGYASGNNLAFEVATGDYLLTLNPDTEFEDDAIDRALAVLKSKSDVGVVGVKLIGPDGETQRSVRGFPTVAGVFGELTGLANAIPGLFGGYGLRTFNYEASGLAPQPMGTFLLFKREALEAIGDAKHPFDEEFPIFFNEVDLLYRLKVAGWNCWFEASAQVRHLHGASTRQVKRSMIWESHRSLVRYFRKHLTGWRRAFLPLLALAASVGAFVRAKGYDAGFRP